MDHNLWSKTYGTQKLNHKPNENYSTDTLALFPDLEQGLNPELYEEIVDILDPDLLDIIGSDDETASRNHFTKF